MADTAGSVSPIRKKIVISGYYGFRNSGDEAVLKSILLALRAEGEAQGVEIDPVVLSGDPAWTAEMYGVKAAHRMKPLELLRVIAGCDGLISGGGSLLQDVTGGKTIPYYTGIIKLAQLLGKPVFIYAQGIGPVLNRRMDGLIRHVMARSAYVSVRDDESAALLSRMGVPHERIDVVPDPVMGLPLPQGSQAAAGGGSAAAAGAPVVGVSLRHWRKDGADLDRAAEALAELARRRPVRLRFLPFHTPADAEASRQVMERLGTLGAGSSAELAAPGDDPQAMLLEVSRCDMLLGMRLHALIYAAGRRVPMLGLSYDPKIDQFLARLGDGPIATTEAMDAAAFADAAERLLDGGDGWRAEKAAAIDKLQQEARKPAQHIVQYLRQETKR
ncbi:MULTISPECIES: polysaccharide pyruvyl transferase CsaB [unclassified Paenibacillus]|uniref:polysaccharide pyruvyl transferase CsaB n=1 Tax=unclassified Paenibacillus TaxID=185978 RepID=UPI000955ACA3|nr:MULTISPECIES: polysaccharide pyruvyl transferase CsaB [unclassified Paenibacillus]ASS67256.1 polysaccharide pyruvyl transferase CsaB [Paenibacillus sp. RUD330]SIQ83934.1 polysaccharide pyruvyl transferase CsaB [Paenibacillus sp. RU4X]SIR04873.1 polysaccharide pyruvyl transferase CsaB [Paenibacillus sp. RU4T]